MKNEKPKRKRIINPASQPIQDPEAYIQNSCSDNAKHIKTFSEHIETEFWIDKHYSDRQLFGDENGKRDGIELEYIENLIAKSFKHLVYYALKHKRFIFVNYPPKAIVPVRIVLKEEFAKQEILNVVAEYHFVELNKYEVTIRTAMRKENFIASDGQFTVLLNDDESVLQLTQGKTANEIDRY